MNVLDKFKNEVTSKNKSSQAATKSAVSAKEYESPVANRNKLEGAEEV